MSAVVSKWFSHQLTVPDYSACEADWLSLYSVLEEELPGELWVVKNHACNAGPEFDPGVRRIPPGGKHEASSVSVH